MIISAELQKLLNEKNAELTNKTNELTERSSQPQRGKRGEARLGLLLPPAEAEKHLFPPSFTDYSVTRTDRDAFQYSQERPGLCKD